MGFGESFGIQAAIVAAAIGTIVLLQVAGRKLRGVKAGGSWRDGDESCSAKSRGIGETKSFLVEYGLLIIVVLQT